MGGWSANERYVDASDKLTGGFNLDYSDAAPLIISKGVTQAIITPRKHVSWVKVSTFKLKLQVKVN